jgi:hypothetical protein
LNLPRVCQKNPSNKQNLEEIKKIEHEATIQLTRKQQILKEILKTYTSLPLIFELQKSILTSCFTENPLNKLNLAGNKQKLDAEQGAQFYAKSVETTEYRQNNKNFKETRRL